MKWLLFLIGGFLLWSRASYTDTGAREVKTELRNSQGEVVGSATLTEESEGVKIALQVSSLPAGLHAFHIHTVGKCDPPDFSSAGSHFNPYGKQHGQKNPEGAHAGDLPNILVGGDGTGKAEAVAKDVTLGEGANSLFHPEGTSLVIHANPDDQMTDPAGNAGPRIACGVI